MKDPSISNKKLGEQLNKLLEAVGLETSQYQFEGLPWRGPPQWVDNHRPDNQPVQDQVFHLNVINTSDEGDRKLYEAIMALILAQKATLFGEDTQVLPDGTGWLIMVRWAEIYFRSPDAYKSYWQRLEA